jgi:sigma-B regulation protein RsbU (phosphoserine phosphatase)
MFATAYYLIADVANGRLRYATAGHPPPLHLQRRTRTVAPLHVPPHAGPALGLFGDAAYSTSECPVAQGDVVLLFTDGLFEVISPDSQEEYGQQRLISSALEHMGQPLPDLCDALIAGVKAFAGGAPFTDDVCLLSIEFERVEKRKGCAEPGKERTEPVP